MLTAVTENIHKLVIQFPEGMGEVNCYLIEGKQGYTVIDTGTDSLEAKEGWKKVLASGITIEKVVLTHAHQDHIGLAKWFQQDVGVPVIVSNLGYIEMKQNRISGTKKTLNELIIKHGGLALPKDIKEETSIYDFEPNGMFENNQEIQLGDAIYQAIWTPGHAPDHFCFYNAEQQVMIIGDHVLKEINPVIGLWTGREKNVLKDYFASLEKIKNFPPKIALPGHGDPIIHLNDRVNKMKEKHEQRLEQVLGLVKNEGKTANEICYEIYGTTHIMLHLSSFMAVLTRLLYLESIGKVQRKNKNGVITFKKGDSPPTH